MQRHVKTNLSISKPTVISFSMNQEYSRRQKTSKTKPRRLVTPSSLICLHRWINHLASTMEMIEDWIFYAGFLLLHIQFHCGCVWHVNILISPLGGQLMECIHIGSSRSGPHTVGKCSEMVAWNCLVFSGFIWGSGKLYYD